MGRRLSEEERAARVEAKERAKVEKATEKRAAKARALAGEWPEDRRFAYWGSRHMTDELMERMVFHEHGGVVAVDVETFGLEDQRLLGIGVATSPHDSFWFPLYPFPSPHVNEVFELLRDRRVKKIFHNVMFDARALLSFGVDETNVVDTLVMARLCGESDLDLHSLAAYREIDIPSFPKMGGRPMTSLGERFMVGKNCLDTQATYAVWESLKGKVHQPSLDLDMALVPVLLRMQRKGVRVDLEELRGLDREYAEKVGGILCTCKLMEFNPASWQQVGRKLREVGAGPRMKRSKKTKKWAVDTAEEALVVMDHPVARLVLDYRKAAKFRSTYITPLLRLGRAYTHYGLNTATGRLTSSDLNLQNLPKRNDPTGGKYRKCFLPDGEWMTKFDFAQQELRILAAISGDREMLRIYEEDGDLHLETAAAVYDVRPDQVTKDMRSVAKTVNFGLVYGSEDETMRRVRDRWKMKFPQAFEWLETQKIEGPRDGYVMTMGGRKMYFPVTKRPDETARESCNYPIQGTGAEATKRAMLRCAHLDMRLQVHDELLFEGDVVGELAGLGLEDVVPGVRLPIEVERMERWE